MSSSQQLQRSIRGLNPSEFEYFLADVWEAKGYETNVRGETGESDMGVDIEAVDHVEDESIVIQAKRYTNGNKVGGPEVRQYAGLRPQENADRVIVVTTSEFTEQGHDVAEKADVELVDLAKIEAEIGKLDDDARKWLAQEWQLPGIEQGGYKPAFTPSSKLKTNVRIWATGLAGPIFSGLITWESASNLVNVPSPINMGSWVVWLLIVSFFTLAASVPRSPSKYPKIIVGSAVIAGPTAFYIHGSNSTILNGIALVLLIYSVTVAPLLLSGIHIREWRTRRTG